MAFEFGKEVMEVVKWTVDAKFVTADQLNDVTGGAGRKAFFEFVNAVAFAVFG